MSTGGLLERETAMRRASFVGRAAELAVLREALDAAGPRVIYVHGPGGVGKSSLLHAFAGEEAGRGRRTVLLDARDFESTREGVNHALDAVGLIEGRPAGRTLVIIDTYELLAPIESELLRDLLRRVDDDTLLIIGSRRSPSAEWRALSLWGQSIRALPLRNLDPEASTRYLDARGVDPGAAASIAAFAHGHPLALAIAADAWRQMPSPGFEAERDLGVIRALYDYFVRGIKEPGQRAVLEAAAVMPTLHEAALAELCGAPIRGAFDWLRGLCFIDSGPRGLYPHDLAREVILAELRWRNTERLAALVLRALRTCAALVEAAPPEQFSRRFADFAFVLSHNPRARALVVSDDAGLTSDDLRDGDHPAILAAIARHEGDDEAAIARHWLRRQPEGFKIARRSDGAVAAFIVFIRLDRLSTDDEAVDPLARAAWEHTRRDLGGADGPVAYTRWYMSCAHHQALDPAMALASRAVGPLVFTPGFSLLFVRMHAWELWQETARLCGAELIPSLAHRAGDKGFVVTLQDHRGLTGVQWLARFSERTSLADWRLADPQAAVDSSLSALSQEDFRARVRDALRALHDPLVLLRNPLIHGHVVARRVGATASAEERAGALAALLSERIRSLGGSARADSWRQVMIAAYVEPEGKHEAAARALAMSYSTFRRLLGAATDYLTAALWDSEIGGG